MGQYAGWSYNKAEHIYEFSSSASQNLAISNPSTYIAILI